MKQKKKTTEQRNKSEQEISDKSYSRGNKQILRKGGRLQHGTADF